jgi:hypothetical protein
MYLKFKRKNEEMDKNKKIYRKNEKIYEEIKKKT